VYLFLSFPSRLTGRGAKTFPSPSLGRRRVMSLLAALKVLVGDVFLFALEVGPGPFFFSLKEPAICCPFFFMPSERAGGPAFPFFGCLKRGLKKGHPPFFPGRGLVLRATLSPLFPSWCSISRCRSARGFPPSFFSGIIALFSHAVARVTVIFFCRYDGAFFFSPPGGKKHGWCLCRRSSPQTFSCKLDDRQSCFSLLQCKRKEKQRAV